MQTPQEQRAFFDQHWLALKAALESGGSAAAIALIDSFTDDLERRVLYVFARQGLVFREWAGKGFDPYIEIADAGIAELLRQADVADDEETRMRRRNGAHIISYNLAADLADCWPGDDQPRSQAHFERGLKAARDCIAWCDPSITDGLARDWWVLGMHQISLGDAHAAVTSFRNSLEFARQFASADPGSLEAEPFAVTLGLGYLALARMISGEKGAQDEYAAAIATFSEQLANELRKEDAKFGIAQLEEVRKRYAAEA